MKFILVLAALVVVALARPEIKSQKSQAEEPEVVKYINDRNDKGEYKYVVELSDGTKRAEEAHLVDEGLETEHLSVIGYFKYLGPDGQTYKTEYKADSEGFKARGDHIPKEPEA